ncbi:unnamed protein product [Linum trigynum]|uniref:Uncharacterized protein n=1 Tax=Linum trigynum TaxID=586398 RepID=A0AAV2FAK2_9ROSI
MLLKVLSSLLELGRSIGRTLFSVILALIEASLTNQGDDAFRMKFDCISEDAHNQGSPRGCVQSESDLDEGSVVDPGRWQRWSANPNTNPRTATRLSDAFFGNQKLKRRSKIWITKKWKHGCFQENTLETAHDSKRAKISKIEIWRFTLPSSSCLDEEVETDADTTQSALYERFTDGDYHYCMDRSRFLIWSATRICGRDRPFGHAWFFLVLSRRRSSAGVKTQGGRNVKAEVME